MRRAALLAALLAACASPERIPVRVVEEHHEAVLVLIEARRAGSFPADGVALVHVDAHADLGVPDLPVPLVAPEGESRADRRMREDRLREALAVDDVLVPAAALGLVREVVWVAPDWLDVPLGEKRWQIGSEAGRGRRFALARELDEIAYPDRRALVVRVTRASGLPPVTSPWVLGIDLDALVCRNPHRGHTDRESTEAEARALLSAGEILDRGTATEGRIRTESTLVRMPEEVWPRRVDRIEEPDRGGVRFVVGWRCFGEVESDRGLPVHDADPLLVEATLMRLAAALAAIAEPPVLVLVSRSATSGFVPADRVDELQRATLEALSDVWPELEAR